MNEWIGLILFILFAIGIWFVLRQLGKPRKTTEQEFERKLGEGGGVINAGMMELDKFLNPRAGRSVEVIQGLKSGKFDKKKSDGDDKNTEQ